MEMKTPPRFEDVEPEAAQVLMDIYARSKVFLAPKLRRNDPCDCGSGKKYKKCCIK